MIFDAGYDPARLAWLLRDLPVQVTGRLGTNRVLWLPPSPRLPGQMGRPVMHGPEVRLAADAARPEPDAETSAVTSRHGTAAASSWNRAHPKLKARGAWEGHQGPLPVIEGTRPGPLNSCAVVSASPTYLLMTRQMRSRDRGQRRHPSFGAQGDMLMALSGGLCARKMALCDGQ